MKKANNKKVVKKIQSCKNACCRNANNKNNSKKAKNPINKKIAKKTANKKNRKNVPVKLASAKKMPKKLNKLAPQKPKQVAKNIKKAPIAIKIKSKVNPRANQKAKNNKPVKIASKIAIISKVAPKKINKPRKMTEAERIEKLVIDNRISAQKLGYSILRRWGVRIEKEELLSVIDYALCDAAIRYIPNKGASFPTYFYYHLRGHLIRLVADLKLANTTYAQLNCSDCISDFEQNSYITPGQLAPIFAKSDLVNSPESLAIREEELTNCSSSVNKLDKLEQAVLTRIYNNEPLTKVARSLGYSRCHISRIKQQALDKLKAIYAHRTNIGNYSNVTQLDSARKRVRARNKNKFHLSAVDKLQAVA